MEILLISHSDFTPYRTISDNVNDVKRLHPFIIEAQRIDLINNYTGKDFYFDIVSTYKSYVDKVAFNSTNPAPPILKIITPKEQAFGNLVNGMETVDAEGNVNGFYSGLKPVLVYLTYARFVLNDQIRSTPSGFVKKNTDFSERISYKEIQEMSSRATADASVFWGFVKDWMKSDAFFKTYHKADDCDCGSACNGRRKGKYINSPRGNTSFRKRVR